MSVHILCGLNQKDDKIDKHGRDTVRFDPQQRNNINIVVGTEKMRAILLNWCRDVFAIFLQRVTIRIEMAMVILKKLLDCVIYDILDGQTNRKYLQLIGTACIFETIVIIDLYHFGLSPQSVERKQHRLSGQLVDYTDNAYQSFQVTELIYALMANPRFYKESRAMGEYVFTYQDANDIKWEAALEVVRIMMYDAINRYEFVSILRVDSMGVQRDGKTDLLQHPEIRQFINVVIECACEIVENMVFQLFHKRLREHKLIALTCLMIAVKQQGAYDALYSSTSLPRYFESVSGINYQTFIEMESVVLKATGWEGCPDLAKRLDFKQYGGLRQLFDK
jgi:hypothetical protein